jgi:hypothetical protein
MAKRGEKARVRQTVMLPPALRLQLKRAAGEERREISGVVEQLVREWLARRDGVSA